MNVDRETAERLNPMIGTDTLRVQNALIALACLHEEEPTMETDSMQGYGVGLILRVCSAALAYMDSERSRI